MAEGLNLIYGVMKTVNFAQGDFIVVGGLITVTAFTMFGLSPIASIVLVAIMLFIIGAIVQKTVIEQLSGVGTQAEMRSLFATFGLSYIVSNAGLLIWGGQVQSVPFFQG